MSVKKNRRLVADPSGNVFSIRPEVKLKKGWSMYQPPAPVAKPTPSVATAPKPAAPPSPPKAKD